VLTASTGLDGMKPVPGGAFAMGSENFYPELLGVAAAENCARDPLHPGTQIFQRKKLRPMRRVRVGSRPGRRGWLLSHSKNGQCQDQYRAENGDKSVHRLGL